VQTTYFTVRHQIRCRATIFNKNKKRLAHHQLVASHHLTPPAATSGYEGGGGGRHAANCRQAPPPDLQPPPLVHVAREGREEGLPARRPVMPRRRTHQWRSRERQGRAPRLVEDAATTGAGRRPRWERYHHRGREKMGVTTTRWPSRRGDDRIQTPHTDHKGRRWVVPPRAPPSWRRAPRHEGGGDPVCSYRQVQPLEWPCRAPPSAPTMGVTGSQERRRRR
jgi:hypothetical protein